MRSVGGRDTLVYRDGEFVGKFSRDTGKTLKARSGWNSNGTDDFGFSALPGGYRCYVNAFCDAGKDGYWWTASKLPDILGYGDDFAYRRVMHYDNDLVDEYVDLKGYGFSVRCVQ